MTSPAASALSFPATVPLTPHVSVTFVQNLTLDDTDARVEPSARGFGRAALEQYLLLERSLSPGVSRDHF